jgi:hypothetical protein
MSRGKTRWLLGVVGAVAIAQALLSTYLYVELQADTSEDRDVSIASTQWTAYWSSNGSAAPVPGYPTEWLGSCWNITGDYASSSTLRCELQFDTGAFGPTPSSQHWTTVENLTVRPPFSINGYSLGVFGDTGGPFEITVVFDLHLPAQPGAYAFLGTFWVS